ncbi:hypothetical protein NLJ89_g4941 [Agrocybe chaxingu]|uniref:ABC transporter n=1 Tax=Agrocybe chaxingu TaxID=84603 RepID=A0A9W8K362_9AGAR|nr:hypothetical protein NLJ89_g4941 [Agrocybe chaxingu]
MSALAEKPSEETLKAGRDAATLGYGPTPWYLRVPFASRKAPPLHKVGLDGEPPMIPEASANFFSLLTFQWMTPLMSLGYARPLKESDLYRLQDSSSASHIGDVIVQSFERRRKTAEEYNERLTSGQVSPSKWKVLCWSLLGNSEAREKYWRNVDGKKYPSLVLAMNDSVKYRFWSAGILKLFADTLTITSPLLVQAIVNFASNSYAARSNPEDAPPIWKGIVLIIGLMLMQAISSLCTHHSWYRAMACGVLVRGGLISAIYSRAFTLSSRARVTLTGGQLVTYIAADVSRIDTASGLAHATWTAPIQIVISLVILLVNLGPNALIGFSVLLLGIPVQSYVMKKSYVARSDSMQYTDKRVKLTHELLGGIRVIKYFAWEEAFLKTLNHLRKMEMKHIRKLLLFRAGNNAVAMSFPVLATVLAFISYTLLGHALEPGVIFSSLTLFQLLRTPVMLLPIALSSVTDAYNATSRIYSVFVAETIGDTRAIEDSAPNGLLVDSASFTWESPQQTSNRSYQKTNKGEKAIMKAAEDEPEQECRVFSVEGINIQVPRGKLCAIVGPVGSGKSSLLQGLVGEMRKTQGSIIFGGSISYCPQSAWIQMGTIRDNICFGKPFNSIRYWKAIHDACLETDLDLLPNGDMTQIGEKGVSLSGGQKQRINIGRSIYANADVQLFDDPLSALDAHVGKDVFLRVLKSRGQNSTRILVTHALHFLPQADFIIVMSHGRISQQGTYDELIADMEGDFAKMIVDYEHARSQEGDEESEASSKNPAPKVNSDPQASDLMRVEEREIGTVKGDVYAFYFKAGKGPALVPLICASLVLVQAVNVMSSFWLIYWQERKWPEPLGFYIGVYSALGGMQALVSFFYGSLFAVFAYLASRELHRAPILRIMYAPMSFFETTVRLQAAVAILWTVKLSHAPSIASWKDHESIFERYGYAITKLAWHHLQRILPDFIDNYLGDACSSALNSFATILGAVVLISAIFPWFLIAVALLFVCYFYFSLFYRASARELNRINNLLRSVLVSHFSESLSGLTTIKAYGESRRFLEDNKQLIDTGNRAYWLTVANQRWLAVRLDAFGVLLTLTVAILSVATRFSLSPSKTGIMLSFILSIQYSLSLVVRQAALAENMMNSVERMSHYANNIEQEAVKGSPEREAPDVWPLKGGIEINEVQLAYRPGLPMVLKGLTMHIRPGEKVGIVGRTGAGKSSIIVALYRLVELTAGSIMIDGVDISKLDLPVLRSSIAVIPQEAVLFLGSVRTNLDPFGQYDDAHLWDALHRSHLVKNFGRELKKDEAAWVLPPREILDTAIENEGSNLSMGERSLISLARALVKKSRVLVLDEATASVDYETDRKIQETIAEEFREQTVLCIAHRLNTIIGYDRVCVMDAGRIAEFDTPANLYNQQGIFRNMCEQSAISLDDVIAAQERKKRYNEA